MDIVANFFNVFYNESLPTPIFDIDDYIIQSMPNEFVVLFLSVNENNIDLYSKSESFVKLYSYFVEVESNPINLDSIKTIQYHILRLVKILNAKELKPHVLRLNTSEIISNQHARNLTNFFMQSSFQIQKASNTEQKEVNLKSLVEELDDILKRLYELKLQESIYVKLRKICENIQNHKFSIGITGVLSAGKSTFLNALLGKEVLGSSTIPETANLTILRYDTREHARVHFWNTSQWEELRKAGQYDKSLQAFVKDSESIFGDKLHSFITNETKTEEIDINQLDCYTSANHESKMCNLVKEVELFTNLKFLQNGVEIVDTPGLDDPITKREEITRSYIEDCDLLIHVMNASCVATQVDIDFILESLLENNISRLLVVLTRIDLISQRDLEQSLEYTKTSLVAQLKKAHYDGDIDSIIDRIDFIPTASFLALLHKTGREQEALDKGFTLDKTGIINVEQYLDKMLIGENSLKQKDILYLAYRGFLKIMESVRDDMYLQSKILNSSEQDLEKMIDELKEENDNLLSQLDLKNQELDSKKNELQDFLLSLQNFVNKSLKSEQDRLKGRIFDEAIYEYAKGNTPSQQRIIEILESGFSDCFSDLSRDYKYRLSRKVAQILLDEFDIKQPHIVFHAPKEQIAKSLGILVDSIPHLVSSHSKGKEHELSIKLDSKFQESFKIFGDVISHKNKEIEDKFLEYFSKISDLQSNVLKEQIAKKEEILNNTIEQRKNIYTQEMRDSIANKQKEINEVLRELSYITQVLK